MTNLSASDILQFWFEDIEHSAWFKKDAEFDELCTRRFGDALESAKKNELDHWCDCAEGYLGLIVLLDQFSRNIHRDSAKAFAADTKALQLTLEGIEKGHDRELTPEQRSFFY